MPELTEEAIINFVKTHRPASLAKLRKILEDEGLTVSDGALLTLVEKLRSEGRIKLYPRSPTSLIRYLADFWGAWWFYASIVVSLAELFLVFYNAQAGISLLLRITFGLGVLGLIPGFLTITTIFPGSQLKSLEKIALSIFLSVLISITVGVVLGLSTFFQAADNIFILTIYVILADIAASYRSYNFLRSPHMPSRPKP